MQRFLPILLFCGVFLIGVITVPFIGASWDEPDNIFAAGVYVKYVQNGFDPAILQLRQNQTASVYGERIFSQNTDLERYPPVPLLLGAVGVSLIELILGPRSGAQIIEIFHMVSGLFLGITAVSTYFLSKRLKLNALESVCVVVITILSPTLFGHGFSTIKDSAQVALFVTTLYFLVSFSYTSKRKFLVFGAISWGLALATKFNAVYIPVIWLIWNFLVHTSVFSLQKNKEKRSLVSRFGLSVLLPSLFLVVIGLLTMIIVWPYLWYNPIERLQEVIRYFTTVGTGYQIIWMGQKYYVGTGTSLWWYPIGSYIISTPLSLLIPFIVGIISVIVSLIYRTSERAKALLSILWLIIPLARIFSPTAAYYDGIRHFLEIFPVVSIICVIGIKKIGEGIDRLFKKKYKVSLGFVVVSSIVIVQLISILIQYFPYTSGYINRLVPNSSTLMDRDFSGLAVHEGLRYVKEHFESSSLWVPIAGHLSWYYLRPEYRDLYVYTPQDADTVIFVNKPSHSNVHDLTGLLPPDYQLVHEIKRGDAIFGWVYRRKDR
jgi:hypothetical protein